MGATLEHSSLDKKGNSFVLFDFSLCSYHSQCLRNSVRMFIVGILYGDIKGKMHAFGNLIFFNVFWITLVQQD